MVIFLNGKFLPEAEAAVSLNDRGFLLGDGLFETTRVAHGRAFRLWRSIRANGFLAAAREFFKIKPPNSTKEIQKFAAELIEKNQLQDGVLRITLTRGPGKRGYSIAGADQPTLAMTLHTVPAHVGRRAVAMEPWSPPPCASRPATRCRRSNPPAKF